MRLAVRTCLASVLIALAVPVAAQEVPAAPSDEIVVTGTKDEDRARQVREFINNISNTGGAGELSRFEQAVCPFAIGLLPNQNRAVVERLRRVATAIGLSVGKESCRPNLLVAVVPGKQAFLEGLARKQPQLFTLLSPREVRKLIRDPAPVAAWQQTGLISSQGTAVYLDDTFDTYVNRTFGTNPLTTEPAHSHFTAAVVVIEADASIGLTTTQIADYAAMRGFARTNPAKVPASAPSILKAVGAPVGTAVPVTLTQWDFGYLRGLYASTVDSTPVARVGEIGRTLERELERPKTEGK